MTFPMWNPKQRNLTNGGSNGGSQGVGWGGEGRCRPQVQTLRCEVSTFWGPMCSTATPGKTPCVTDWKAAGLKPETFPTHWGNEEGYVRGRRCRLMSPWLSFHHLCHIIARTPGTRPTLSISYTSIKWEKPKTTKNRRVPAGPFFTAHSRISFAFRTQRERQHVFSTNK